MKEKPPHITDFWEFVEDGLSCFYDKDDTSYIVNSMREISDEMDGQLDRFPDGSVVYRRKVLHMVQVLGSLNGKRTERSITMNDTEKLINFFEDDS